MQRKAIVLPKLVSFVIPTLVQIDMLKKCIKSIHDVCMKPAGGTIPYEIIVVADGSPLPILKELKCIKESLGFRLIINLQNLGYTKPVNMGIRQAAGDYIILVNDDIVFEDPNWLNSMIRLFNHHPRIGIAGCRLIFPDRTIQHGGMVYVGGFHMAILKHRGQPENYKEANKILRTVTVAGGIMVIRRQVIRDIGLLNEDFLILGSDTDYCLTAHTRGWRVIYNGRCYAIHHESQTRKKFEIGGLPPTQKQDLTRLYHKWKDRLEAMHKKGMI